VCYEGEFALNRIHQVLAGLLLLLAASGWPAPAAASPSTSLCVNQGGTGGCLGSITAAIAAASNGDTILIAGAATPYLERLTINKSLNLTGDSAATTIIDGGAIAQVIRITASVTVTLSNLTIRNGQSGAGNLLDQWGGGIHADHANLTLNDSVVSGNHTGGAGGCCGGGGGGIYIGHGTLALNHTLVTGNTTGTPNANSAGGGQGGPAGDGGGIYSDFSRLSLNFSTISHNATGPGSHGDTLGGTGGYGGGLITVEGTVFLNNSAIVDNASGDGGSGGTTGGDGGLGGGIFNQASALTVHHSTIGNNVTGAGGTGGSTRGASGSGAGLYARGPNAPAPRAINIETSTLSGNATGRGLANGFGGDGGAIYSKNQDAITVTNSTLAWNTVDDDKIGGGIANETSTVKLQNSLVVNNHQQSGPDAVHDCAGALVSLGYNLMTEPDCTPAIIATTGDQFYVGGDIVWPLTNNGGPTLTNALKLGSPAIDASDNSTCLSTDQRGFARPVFGGAQLRCDIGAFELYRFGLRLPLLMR
jgi:hypothetical protein